MSPSPEARRNSACRDDAGFSLIEVVVALGILMLVVVTLLPQLIVGIQATGTARLVTQAKGVAQAEFERMRNLPYHISSEAGDFRDVLDFYYKNKASGTTPTCTNGAGVHAPPQTGWTGYVSPTGTRCAYEPAGAFYRTVREVPPSSGIAGFSVVVATQFLTGATPPQPVTPEDGYDTQTPAGGRPASQQIGVTVTVLYSDRATLKPATSFTQISNQLPVTTRIRAEASATALQIGSVTLDNGPVSLSAGLVNLTGSLTHASTIAANTAGVTAGLTTGTTSTGTARSVTAPPSTTAEVLLPGVGSLGTTGCVIVCWGNTRLEIPALTATDGLPNAGSAASPVQGLVTDTTNEGFSFGNSPAAEYRPELGLVAPLVKVDPDTTPNASGVATGCAPGTSGAASYTTASGYVRTTRMNAPSDPAVVDACVVARTSSLSLFPVEATTVTPSASPSPSPTATATAITSPTASPTATASPDPSATATPTATATSSPDATTSVTPEAPRGIVLVELRRAVARCQVQTTAHTASTSFEYEAEVKYWDGTSYQTAATVTQATGTDPLEAIELATTSVGGSKYLGDYIASWSALTSAEVTASTAGGTASVQIPGVVTIVTQPVRDEPTSVVSLTVGALSCSATDAR